MHVRDIKAPRAGEGLRGGPSPEHLAASSSLSQVALGAWVLWSPARNMPAIQGLKALHVQTLFPGAHPSTSTAT